jgi:hypothetical protein
MSFIWYLNMHLWVAHTLSQSTSWRYGRVSSNSATVEATKFAGPHKYHMHQYIIELVHWAKRSILNRLRQTIPPSKLQIWKFSTLNLPIRYSPLSPNCPTWSHIFHIQKVKAINHIGPPSRERALSEAVFPTNHLLLIAYTTRHSHSNILSYR